MMVAAKYFRQKADECRQIAQSLTNQDGSAVSKLISLAEEFDSTAQALETRFAGEASRLSGLDDVLRIH